MVTNTSVKPFSMPLDCKINDIQYVCVHHKCERVFTSNTSGVRQVLGTLTCIDMLSDDCANIDSALQTSMVQKRLGCQRATCFEHA